MKFAHVHFIGIKGVAMTALAILAKEQGSKVTGSDLKEDFPTAEVLARFKIVPRVGFTKENIKLGKPDLVVVTGAHGGLGNPEAEAAKKMDLRVLMHGQALALFMAGKKGIAVAGSHGKTTTAAMVAHILVKAGLDPSFAVGCGQIKSLGSPGQAGQGDYFVVEADEYMTDPGRDKTPRFFHLKPFIGVITNIDYDHPDAFLNLEEVKQTFLTFAQKVPAAGALIVGIDDKNVRAILPKIKSPILSFGFSTLADCQIKNLAFGQERTFFNLEFAGVNLGQFALKVPGKHNVLNAVAASLVANHLGVSWQKIGQVLTTFSGTKRRFEFIGERGGVAFYDDYAHHPTEIAATLEAARAWFPQRRIMAIFQPHTFSRTKALLGQFARSFAKADQVIVTEIYPSAREKPDPTINSQILASQIQQHHKATFFVNKDKLTPFLKSSSLAGDIILTMGAGDIYKLGLSMVK